MQPLHKLHSTEQYKKYVLEQYEQKHCATSLVYKNTRYGTWGTFHATTLATYAGLVRSFLDELPKGTFLDIGSGIGCMLIYAAKQGWQSKGIEYAKPCWEAAQMQIKKANLAKKIDNKYASCFPKTFKIKTYLQNKKEDDFRETLAAYTAPPIQASFLDAHVWYHYQVERRQNILDLFDTYAHIGSYIIIVKTRDDTLVIPEHIVIHDTFEEMSIYKKTKR